MEWTSLDGTLISTAPLIPNNDFSIDYGDVEFRNGKYILQEDESISLTCNSTDLRIRNIRPDEGYEYVINESGLVVFEGSKLEGDRYGNLQVGIFHISLDYPIEVLSFKLTAPFSVKGTIEYKISENRHIIEINRFSTSNVPPEESSRYPYILEYNISTDDGEKNWKKLPRVFERPRHFEKRTHTIDAPSEIKDSNTPLLRIRLQSAHCEIYRFRAICTRKEIIRLSEPCPPVPLLDWIKYPKALNIVHEKYRFDENTMEESWQEYSMLSLESAFGWLDFEPLKFTVEASKRLNDSGEFIEIDLVFDLTESKDLMESPSDFLLSLELSIGRENFGFQDSRNFSIDNETSQIRISIQKPLPYERIIFNPRTTKMANYGRHWLNEGEEFFSNSPFSKTNWNLQFILFYKQKPSSHSKTAKKLGHWNKPLIKRGKNNNLYSRFHPAYAKLYKAEYKRIRPNKNIFCIECGTMGFPTGEIFKCPNYKCGWSNDKLNLVGFEVINHKVWFEYQGKSDSEHTHHFLLVTDYLSVGEYVVAFNGMSFHFDVS